MCGDPTAGASPLTSVQLQFEQQAFNRYVELVRQQHERNAAALTWYRAQRVNLRTPRC